MGGGALLGAAGGALGGAIGGKVLGVVGKELLGAASLGTRMASNALAGGVTGFLTGGVMGAATYRLNCGDKCSWAGAGEAALGGAVAGGVMGAVGGAFGGMRAKPGAPTAEPEPEAEPAANKCTGCACNSFDAKTPVLLANGQTEPIKDVKLGDKVKATDPGTGKTAGQPVTALHLNRDTDLTDLGIRTSNGVTVTVHTTQHHPFYDVTHNAWVDAGNLNIGDRLYTTTGTAVVTTVHSFTGLHPMYNLTVDQVHTYYVEAGTTPVLVHNCDVTPTDHVHGTDRDPLTRVDNRHPDEVFQDGFKPWNSNGNNDLQVHVDDSPRGNLVSASRNPEGVGAYPWLYDIDAPGGIDLNATALEHGNLEPNWGENEVTFPGGIPARYIRGAQQYDEFDNPIGDYLSNPNYRP